jgi:RNA polymerase sigma-70 factor (ECF subfamily)
MARVRSLSDQELLPLLRDGDDYAFKELYGRYHSELYSFLYKFLKSPELTEDLTQEVFIKFWDQHTELPQLISIRAYLFTLGKNHAFNFLKRAGIDRTAKAEILKYYPTEGNSLESAIHFNDYKRYLDGLLETLTPQSREVFRLCRTESKTYDETAEILGISRNAVKKHMVRSMRILGDSVERDLGISLTVLFAILMRP